MTDVVTAMRFFPEGLLPSFVDPPVLRRAAPRAAPGDGAVLRAFLDESGLLLRAIREAVEPRERGEALRRLEKIARNVDACAVAEALSVVAGFHPADTGDDHLDALARLHAAAAEACAAAAGLVSRAEAAGRHPVAGA